MEDLFNNNINYKKVLFRFISYKRVFYFSLIVFLLAAFMLNKLSVPKYKNSTTISVSKSESNPFLSSQSDMMMGMNMFSGTLNVENELEILKSFSVIKNVVDDLDLKVTYMSFKNSSLANSLFNTPFVKKNELYKDSPIKVIIDPSFPQAVYLNFRVIFVNDDEFQIITSGQDVYQYNYIDDDIVSYVDEIFYEKRFKYGDEIKTKYFNFRILKTQNFDKNFTENQNLYFYFNNMNSLTLLQRSLLDVEITSQMSTLIKVTLKGTNKAKITDFLNGLSSVYLERNLDKKNRIALSTVDFIDSQISDISDSLLVAETNLKNFRTSNQVMDLSFQGQQIFQQINQLESEEANLEMQKRYYLYIHNYLSNNKDISNIVAPSSMQVVDPILTNLISNLLALSNERASLLKNSTNQQNLYLEDIDLRISNLINSLRENVSNTLTNLNASINEINYRLSKFSNQVSEMPKTELQLKGIQRKFTLNDVIYTFLLQKRSEAQIARASSMPDYEVIDIARLPAAWLVYPKSKLNYLIALFLGILLPASFILLKDLLNNKISDIEEIEAKVNKPILGKVFHNFRKTTLVTAKYPNSSVTESFRAIRTNFQFFNDGGKKQVVLMTSSSSGEGKTFCSINFASSLALNGHRTVLLEFDLRRPKIHQEFGSSNMIGITSYLIDKAVLEDIIMPTEVENLDLISAGPAAPNPAELLGLEKTHELIENLKEMYDYIVIDSAPVGLVSETFLLMKHTDVNIFVVRMDKTIRESMFMALRSLENNNFDDISILINDLNVKRDAYKYGYDTKYYHDDRSKFLGGIFNSKRKAS
ncbi:MAG: polysaccharide biosynthesis tyrosine autokinase [Bacteroidales bacterium]|nr:polysaccharide biosynthesis tyrosine autokinase [Bacteroidales bacterium]